MGLFVDLDEGYTKTGKGFFATWSDRASYIPILGAPISMFMGVIGTGLETISQLFKGNVGSAVTELAAGTVGTATNVASSAFWFINAGSGIASGRNIGNHARALTEGAIGGVSDFFNARPQVLKSYTAGIGSAPASMMPSGPGRFAANVSAQRGENADVAYARYMSGEGGVHVNELQSAHGRGA